MNRLGAAIRIPDVPVQSDELRSFASQLGRIIWRFNLAVNRALIAYREPIWTCTCARANRGCSHGALCLKLRPQSMGRRSASIPPQRIHAIGTQRRRAFPPAVVPPGPTALGNLNDNEDRAVLGTANSF